MRAAHNSKLKTQNCQRQQFKTQNSKFKIRNSANDIRRSNRSGRGETVARQTHRGAPSAPCNAVLRSDGLRQESACPCVCVAAVRRQSAAAPVATPRPPLQLPHHKEAHDGFRPPARERRLRSGMAPTARRRSLLQHRAMDGGDGRREPASHHHRS